jgi:hypothetical protein
LLAQKAAGKSQSEPPGTPSWRILESGLRNRLHSTYLIGLLPAVAMQAEASAPPKFCVL